MLTGAYQPGQPFKRQGDRLVIFSALGHDKLVRYFLMPFMPNSISIMRGTKRSP